jgi:hypothetical protein
VQVQVIVQEFPTNKQLRKGDCQLISRPENVPCARAVASDGSKMTIQVEIEVMR